MNLFIKKECLSIPKKLGERFQNNLILILNKLQIQPLIYPNSRKITIQNSKINMRTAETKIFLDGREGLTFKQVIINERKTPNRFFVFIKKKILVYYYCYP